MWKLRRPWLAVPTGVQTALAAVLCFVPLFDLLAYEFALAVALVGALSSPAIGLGVARESPRAARALGRAWAYGALHLAPGLVLISANALRVQNCDFARGLAFFALVPLPTVVYGATLGVIVGAALPRQRLGTQGLALALVVAAPLVMALWALYAEPPIFVFDHLYGYFAGSLYDETIPLDARLGWFRAGTLLRVALLASALILGERLADRSRLIGLLVAALAALATDHVLGTTTGYRVDRATIEQELSQVVTRPGLVVRMSPRVDAKLAQRIADDHAFRLAQLEAALDVHSTGVITSYLYDDVGQKTRLMGGRGTMIAKPWLREIHVHTPAAPHGVVPHELAHALAAEFGSPGLRVSARALVFVNMALVEGLAEALTPEQGAFDLHTWARALRKLGFAPDLRQLLGPAGFWAQAPSRAYTVAGSFVRHLLSTRGPAPLRRAYADGDFAAAYGRPLDELVGEWERFLDSTPVAAYEWRLAEERFRTPSIFARPCAHEISRLRDEAARATPRDAVRLHETICAHLADAPSARLDLALAKLRARDVDGFLALARALDTAEGLTTAQRGQLAQATADAYWQRGELDRARAALDRSLELAPSLDVERLQWVRRWLLDLDEALREPLRRFLAGELAPVTAVVLLNAYLRDHPDDPTASYLVARQLVRAESCREALPYLAPSHPFAPIELERQRLRAECAVDTGLVAEGRAAYETLARDALTSGDRARAYDALARLDWLARRRAPTSSADDVTR